MENYDLIEELGRGSFGVVVKALDKRAGHPVAIKVIAMETDNSQQLAAEIATLRECDCVYIVSYLDSLICQRSEFELELWIVMEYCPLSVGDVLRTCGMCLGERLLSVVCRDICKALSYLHKQKVTHRDVKAGNVLLTSRGHCKLADFGVSSSLATTITSKHHTVIGSPYWMAPEVIDTDAYDQRADIWSLGVTIIEMAQGRPPLYDLLPMRALLKIPYLDPPTFSDSTKWSAECKDFLSKCLCRDARKRASANMLLAHRWMEIMERKASRTQMQALVSKCSPLVDAKRVADREPGAVVYELKSHTTMSGTHSRLQKALSSTRKSARRRLRRGEAEAIGELKEAEESDNSSSDDGCRADTMRITKPSTKKKRDRKVVEIKIGSHVEIPKTVAIDTSDPRVAARLKAQHKRDAEVLQQFYVQSRKSVRKTKDKKKKKKRKSRRSKKKLAHGDI